jgi:hypothetical protein
VPRILILGMYNGDTSEEEQTLFISERHCFSDLVKGVASPCACCLPNSQWILDSTVQVQSIYIVLPCIYKMSQKGHVLGALFKCSQCKSSRTWSSSRVLNGQYLVKYLHVCVFT